MQYLLTGLLVSLSGSLPLGNLNVTAMLIAAGRNLKSALWFALGATLIEVIYLRITLLLLNSIVGYTTVFWWFRVFTIGFMVMLSIGSFMSVGKSYEQIPKASSKFKGIWAGMVMSMCNPMQVPFWLGWAIYLLSASLITGTAAAYNVFSAGAGIGTFCALLIFIMAGVKFSAIMQRHRRLVHIFTGTLFLLMAGFQVFKLL